MKLLTRIRLVNWHLFENTTINCQGTTYFIGINGAGKSTVRVHAKVVIEKNLQ